MVELENEDVRSSIKCADCDRFRPGPRWKVGISMTTRHPAAHWTQMTSMLDDCRITFHSGIETPSS